MNDRIARHLQSERLRLTMYALDEGLDEAPALTAEREAELASEAAERKARRATKGQEGVTVQTQSNPDGSCDRAGTRADGREDDA